VERRKCIDVTEKGINVLPKGKEIGYIKAQLLSAGNVKINSGSPVMNPKKREIWPLGNIKPMNG
jgi:hypothetical protein